MREQPKTESGGAVDRMMPKPMTFDIVVCGAGLAGSTLARQLRRACPNATIASIDPVARPLPDACHKVGESTVELATHYLAHELELEGYLRTEHILKNGLRFFPGGGDSHPLEKRTEIGPPELPIVPSFQLDRGRLETDLRAMNEQDRVELFEGFKVTAVDLRPGDEAHEVTIARGRERRTLRARWVVDATGRRRLLSRKLGLQRSTDHVARAAWFRVAERVDIADLVPESESEWHGRDRQHIRWQSTNHFMGEGYWAWLIPLSSGYTSVGVVVDGELFDFDAIHTEPKLRAWLDEHEPVLARRLADAPACDFRCYREYSYSASKTLSSDRWATVGEAAVFVDPFYSPGSDFIALANSFVTRAIREDLETGDASVADTLSEWFLRLCDEAVVTFRSMMPAFGNPQVMTAKIYWDNLQYWSFLCQFYFQRAYELPLERQREVLAEGERFTGWHARAQQLFRRWHELGGEIDLEKPRNVYLPPVPSILANAYLDLQRNVGPDELLPFLREKRELTEQVLGELVIRALRELPVDAGERLAGDLDLASWDLPFEAGRLALEDASPRDRRRALPKIAKDVERCLGKPPQRPEVEWEAHLRACLGLEPLPAAHLAS